MSFAIGDLVVETSSTELTGDYELNGAVAGRRRFRDVLADGGRTYYYATDGTSFEWGEATLTYGAPDVLSRSVTRSSLGPGVPVSWGSGPKLVYIEVPAEKRVWVDADGFPVVQAAVRADGTDQAAALSAAIDAAQGRRIQLPAGTITIASPLDFSAASFHLAGQRAERGQLKGGVGTVLDASALGAGQWLIDVFSTTPPFTSSLGPFVIEDMEIRVGAAHGLQFGRPDLDDAGTVDRAQYDALGDNVGQRYVHGVQLRNATIRGTRVTPASDAGGVIARSGQRLLRLTKCFESTVENVMLDGGDVALEAWGCDALSIDNVRANYCHVPLLLQRSNFFGAAQNRVSRFQSEHYTFGAIVLDSISASLDAIRCEANVGSPAKHGVWDMTDDLGIGADVTAGSATISFRQAGAPKDMTGILHPYLSLIEVDVAGNTELCWVHAVAGSEVTVWSVNFRFTDTAAGCTVRRIHGWSLLGGGTFNITINGFDAEPYLRTPALVYVAQSGSMHVHGANKNPGTNTPTNLDECRARIVGNIISTSPNMQRGLVLHGVSASLIGDAAHPLLIAPDNPGSHGMHPQHPSYRIPREPVPVAAASLPGFRQWIFTPRNYTTNLDGLDQHVFRIGPGDTGTRQRMVWWELPAGSINRFQMENILSQAYDSRVSIFIVARARTGSATYQWQTHGNLGSLLYDRVVGTDWDVFQIPYQGLPTEWVGPCGVPYTAGLRILPVHDIQLAGILVREEPRVATLGETVARLSGLKTGAKGVALDLCRIAPRTNTANASLKLRLTATVRGGNQGYCWCTTEHIVHYSTRTGTAAVVGTAHQNHKHQDSINAGSLAIDTAVTVSAAGLALTLAATATVGGSSAGTVGEVVLTWAVETLGVGASELEIV